MYVRNFHFHIVGGPDLQTKNSVPVLQESRKRTEKQPEKLDSNHLHVLCRFKDHKAPRGPGAGVEKPR